MGLKKDYYYFEDLGVPMQPAYAILKDLVLNGNNARAIFIIQSSRETTKSLKPIDKVEVNFEWDRKSDLAKMAYETAKTQKNKEYVFDETSGQYNEIETYGTLFGWQNDIVE